MSLPKLNIIGECKDCIYRNAIGQCENDIKLVDENDLYQSFDRSDSLLVSAIAPIQELKILVGDYFGCKHWVHKGFKKEQNNAL